MDVVFLVGRILFVLIFLMSGVSHLTQRKQMAENPTAELTKYC